MALHFHSEKRGTTKSLDYTEKKSVAGQGGIRVPKKGGRLPHS